MSGGKVLSPRSMYTAEYGLFNTGNTLTIVLTLIILRIFLLEQSLFLAGFRNLSTYLWKIAVYPFRPGWFFTFYISVPINHKHWLNHLNPINFWFVSVYVIRLQPCPLTPTRPPPPLFFPFRVLTVLYARAPTHTHVKRIFHLLFIVILIILRRV